MSGIITLTTDFGLTDSYVAAIKGVILGLNPDAHLVDICHTIQPQNIAEASFILGTAWESFPRRTVHLAIVDPGVGTDRSAIVLRTPEADFIGPDNGIFSAVIRHYAGKPPAGERVPLADVPEIKAYVLTEQRFWRTPVSATFHGRDIFAPVAAHLSLHAPPSQFGVPAEMLAVLPENAVHTAADGSLTGAVIHVDAFGNCITGIREADLPKPADAITIEVAGTRIRGLSRTYASGNGVIALIGSGGYLEIALPNGNAAAMLKVHTGAPVKISPAC